MMTSVLSQRNTHPLQTPSATSLQSPDPECAYQHYSDTINKPLESPMSISYPESNKPFEFTKTYSDTFKFPDHQIRIYESIPAYELPSKNYLNKNPDTQSFKYHERDLRYDSQMKPSFDGLPKYFDKNETQVVYQNTLKYGTSDVGSSFKPYSQIPGQYYSQSDGYSGHQESHNHQQQASFYPCIPATTTTTMSTKTTMAQSPYTNTMN